MKEDPDTVAVEMHEHAARAGLIPDDVDPDVLLKELFGAARTWAAHL